MVATECRRLSACANLRAEAAALLLFACVALATGCASTVDSFETGPYAQRMKTAGESYVTCVYAQAEKDAANPVGVEDIAVAAHGRCWTEWDAYRDATNTAFSAGASTRDEKQFAHDRTDAHLRQFERETRRGVVDRLVERTLTKKDQR
jgi:hypothetical protein